MCLMDCLGSLVLVYTSDRFLTLEVNLYVQADDSTLVVVVPSQLDRVAVADTLNLDLNMASECCNLSRMNVSKSKTMIVSMACTIRPQSPPLTLGGTVL